MKSKKYQNAMEGYGMVRLAQCSNIYKKQLLSQLEIKEIQNKLCSEDVRSEGRYHHPQTLKMGTKIKQA